MDKINPWRRYRLNRMFKFIVFTDHRRADPGLEVGHDVHGRPSSRRPGRFFDILFVNPIVGLPLFFTLIVTAMYGLFSLLIFFGIFMIGGIETYKAGEIKTRFRDVWGQDPVLHKVQENIDFLEKPAEIEAKGGYVPSGILLWGPPGHGQDAHGRGRGRARPASRTCSSIRRPSCRPSSASAPMKIKWLYRKLRKQALRHGGVVVFFDEADVLGNRGSTGSGGQFDARRENAAAGLHTCNAAHYVDDHAAVDRVARPAAAGSAQRIDGEDQKPEKRGIIMGGMGGAAAWAPCRPCSPRCPA